MSELRVFSEGCRCHWCASCCRKIGVDLYRDVFEVLASFSSLLMVTLTVDRTKYDGPGEAYDYLNGEIGRLFDRLRRKGVSIGRTFKVIECHSDQEGWPHWHILVEADFIPYAVLQEQWVKLGGGPVVWVGKGPKGRAAFKNARHAAAYALKYVYKPPKVIPEWVLERQRIIRRFDRSKYFASGGRKRESPRPAEERPCKAQKPKCKRQRRCLSIWARMALCASRTIVMRETRRDTADGVQTERKYLATVPMGIDDVLQIQGLPPRECFEGKSVRVRERDWDWTLTWGLMGAIGKGGCFEYYTEPPWSPYYSPPASKPEPRPVGKPGQQLPLWE